MTNDNNNKKETMAFSYKDGPKGLKYQGSF